MFKKPLYFTTQVPFVHIEILLGRADIRHYSEQSATVDSASRDGWTQHTLKLCRKCRGHILGIFTSQPNQECGELQRAVY